MAADKVVQVKNKYEDGSSTDTTTKNVLAGETSTTYTQAPDAATQAFVQQQMTPVAQSMGIDPNTRKVVTPFEVIGYNPEKERQRREAEQLLNERKKKESGWYNALSIVGDALTAAHGGNVWRRESNRTAAQAERDNQRLIAEQKAEDVYNREKLRNQELAYAKMLNDAIQPYLTKTTVKDKDYEQQTETTTHGKKSGYKMDAFKVSDGDGGSGSGSSRSSSSSSSRSGGGKTNPYYLRVITDINTPQEQDNTFDFDNKKDYEYFRDYIKRYYNDLINKGSASDASESDKKTRNNIIEFLKSIGAMDDAHEWKNVDAIMTSGRFFGEDANMWQKIGDFTQRKFQPKGEKVFGVVPKGGGQGEEIDEDFSFIKE
ncbi:MAG: hypothetical protein MJZ64_00380 [Paludibacteraceae bacterium]|nr:hypothetical protein [Paludibacteraceae bacterium]